MDQTARMHMYIAIVLTFFNIKTHCKLINTHIARQKAQRSMLEDLWHKGSNINVQPTVDSLAHTELFTKT